MRRIVASLLALLFIVGVQIVPVFHRIHCAGHQGTHAADHCPACQLANTPVVAAACYIAPLLESSIVDRISCPAYALPAN